MKSVAGAKDGMKQGELGGALKELGYTPEQVCPRHFVYDSMLMPLGTLGFQVLDAPDFHGSSCLVLQLDSVT